MKELDEKYIKTIVNTILKEVGFSVSSYIKQDLYQEGWIGYIKARASYDINKGTAFKSWVYTQIRGRISHFLRKEFLGFHQNNMINYCEFDDIIYNNKIDVYKDIENKNYINKALSLLNNKEQEYIKLYLQGLTDAEISDKMLYARRNGINWHKSQAIKKIKKELIDE